MKKQGYLGIIIFLLFSMELAAEQIAITPLQIYTREDNLYSGEDISREIARGNLFLGYSSLSGVPVASLIDASSFCEKEGIDNLIYGFLIQEGAKISIELRFYNHESRTVRTVFYASDNTTEYNRLIDNIKSKINAYLINELGLYEKKEDVSQPGVLSVPIAAGYWIPMDHVWSDKTISLFSFRTGIRFNPFIDILKLENLAVNFHFGLSILYEMALNDPDYETYTLHKLKMLIPLELSLFVLEKHRFSLILAPLYQLEILDKRRSYSDPIIELSSGFGFSSGVAYHHKFSEHFSAGLSANVDFVFYDSPQITFRPEFTFLIHSGPALKGEK